MQVAQQPAVLGVTRSPWSITWDAHVATVAAGAGCGGAGSGADTAGLSVNGADKVRMVWPHALPWKIHAVQFAAPCPVLIILLPTGPEPVTFSFLAVSRAHVSVACTCKFCSSEHKLHWHVQVFLGSFTSPATAARAHDVAALRIGCASPATGQLPEPSQAPLSAAAAANRGTGTRSTNYPAAGYEEGLAETKGASIADFIVALQRHGAFDSQRGSR